MKQFSALTKITFVLGTAFLLSFGYDYFGDPWEIPAEYKDMKNPVTADKESLKLGRSIYNKHCKSCHGSEGLGDGSKAAQLDTPCGDFSTSEFQAQSDGVLYYKSVIGRDEMPNFEKKLRYEEDRWHVINFIHTLGEES